MNNNNKRLEEEQYLKKTIAQLQLIIDDYQQKKHRKRTETIDSRRDMWENTAHSAQDYDKMSEMAQHLQNLKIQEETFIQLVKTLRVYETMLSAPYFARFDFQEEGESCDKIYLGIHTLYTPSDNMIYVYDWRSPIGSMFYQYELGPCSYQSPHGIISGAMNLKRQYKIQNGKLEYFFDTQVNIMDEMLKDALSQNTSKTMKTIVETIQKKQDEIIRNVDHDLLIIQGAAGSGKTSVALHRIAFFMYEGLMHTLKPHHILILSPNDIFSQYIASVLPQLGEDNVERITFEEILKKTVPGISFTTQFERWDTGIVNPPGKTKTAWNEWKGAHHFAVLINRFLQYYQNRLHPFFDIYYDGKILFTKEELKMRVLGNKANIPLAAKLQNLEDLIREALAPLIIKKEKRYTEYIMDNGQHAFEEKAFAKYILHKQNQLFWAQIYRITRIEPLQIYRLLLKDPVLLRHLAKGLVLPKEFSAMCRQTYKRVSRYHISYEDGNAIGYLALLLKPASNQILENIRHIVVDEAQDYSPLQYHILKKLFPSARYTIVGDKNQALGFCQQDFYEQIAAILDKSKPLIKTLDKSYRSTTEITVFSKRFLTETGFTIPFERHGEKPAWFTGPTDQLLAKLKERLSHYENQRIGLLCRTKKEAERLYLQLRDAFNLSLFDFFEDQIVIMPVYMAKGLEFDCAFLWNLTDAHCALDKKLMYVAVTRALSVLELYDNKIPAAIHQEQTADYAHTPL